MEYSDLYKKGIKHLDDDLYEIVHCLHSGESVCLCSALQMGDVRLMDYLAYVLARQDEFNVIYDANGELDENTLKAQLKKSSKKSVIIIPYLSYKNTQFRDYFQRLLTHDRGNILSVTRLYYDFLKNPADHIFTHTVKPISFVKIRKPLNFELTRSVIETRRILNGWNIPKKFERDIYSYSGGIIGLIKQLCSYIDKFANLSAPDVLIYPPVVRVLADQKLAFDTLDTKRLKLLGLLNKNGKISGSLLENYINDITPQQNKELAPLLQDILNYLVKNKGSVVSIADIDLKTTPAGEISLWRIYKAISRLKKATAAKYVIRNIKGKGYILKER